MSLLNSNAIDILEQNLNNINLYDLSENINNINNINWYYLELPNYNYDYFKSRMDIIREELMMKTRYYE